jgi:histidinol-phosphate phosphatase family protein
MPTLDWKIDDSWTLFLDRDGVINQRIFGGYVTSQDEFVFKEGAIEAITNLSKLFGHVIVVTNQQGIAKKIMTERNLFEIHDYMVEKISDAGGEIKKVYFASNLKGDLNDERKPLPAMALKAQKDFESIDFNKSVMVGDTDTDILFGKNLGMKTVLVKSNEIVSEQADVVVSSLNELNALINE